MRLLRCFQKTVMLILRQSVDDSEFAFTAQDWNSFSLQKQQQILLQYRLTYLAETEVNWCPELGTVLANDEIINGVSERGGFPVVRKKMTQWSMRISAYAERLLQGLNKIDWTDALKESQRNWIGKSVGASVVFDLENYDSTYRSFYNPSRHYLRRFFYDLGARTRIGQSDYYRRTKSRS